MVRMWTTGATMMTRTMAGLAVALLVGAGCSSATALEDIPPGSEVTIETDDGRIITGKLVEVETETVVVEEGDAGTLETIRRDTIADVETPASTGALDRVFSDEPEFDELTVNEGQTLSLSLETALASNSASVGDLARARTRADVLVDGRVAIPAGAEVRGEVTEAAASGKVKGRARLGLRFGQLMAHGDWYDLAATPVIIEAEGTKADDAAKIGIGAAAGAVIGGIAGGGEGAAVGSAIGGGAGTAVVLSTPGEEAVLSSGQEISIRLTEPMRVEVPRATP